MFKDFNLKQWTYKGIKLDNVFIILWKLVWLIPLKFFLAITCLCALVGFGVYSATEIWKAVD